MLGLAGIFLEASWLVRTALVVLFSPVAVEFVGRHESDNGESREDC